MGGVKVVLKVLLALSFALFSNAWAGNAIWQETPDEGLESRSAESRYYRPLTADLPGLKLQLENAPQEFTSRQGATIELPMPDGTLQRFEVEESPIMEPELAALFPEIRTYRASGIDDPTATARLDTTPAGFHAMIQGALGTVYIDPDSAPGAYRSYFKGDFVAERGGAIDIPACSVHGARSGTGGLTHPILYPARTGAQMRTYRLAVAATGEYTQFYGGTVNAGQAAIVTAINRVNQIYKRDLAVRLVLVGNNSNLVYTNGATDPYTNNSGLTMLGENQTNVDSVIGAANYDIGHVFSTAGGGIASLSSVCGANKAMGVTGLSNPTGDPFYIDYVAHELGHQFGGNHTFNGTTSSCASPNRNASTAYEPGSGSTIMAYAGICGAENVQNSSDATFHAGSIAEMIGFVAGGEAVCSSSAATGNNPPDANAGGDYAIPCGTSSVLTGVATDPDVGDTLTYQWDQMDVGTATDSGNYGTDLGNNALFRSFPPRASAFRHFPRLPNQLAHRRDDAETLPTASRNMNFRLTVRDGNAGVDEDDVRITVDNSTGPFAITSLVPSRSSYNSFDAVTINWDVAGSDGAAVNCSSVDIDLLTFNAGRTSYCAHTLVSNTPNDGAQQIAIPVLANNNACFRVMCRNNIFYDITNSDVSIVAGSSAPTNCIAVDSSGGVSSNSVSAGSCSGGSSGGGNIAGGGGGGGAYDLWLLALLGVVWGCRLRFNACCRVQPR